MLTFKRLVSLLYRPEFDYKDFKSWMRESKRFFATLVCHNDEEFRFASNKLQDDKDYILYLLTLKQHLDIYKFLSKRLKNDREIVVASIKNCGMNLEHIPQRYKNERGIVLQSIESSNGYSLIYAPKKFRDDYKVVKKALSYNGLFLNVISERLLYDRELIELSLRTGGSYYDCLKYVPKPLLDDYEFMLKIFKNGIKRTVNVKRISPRLRKDKAFVLELIDTFEDDVPLQFFDKSLRSDKEVVLKSVAKDGTSIRFAMYIDRDVINRMIFSEKFSYNLTAEYIDDVYSDDYDIMNYLCSKSSYFYNYTSLRLRKDLDFLLSVVYKNPDFASCLSFPNWLQESKDNLMKILHIKTLGNSKLRNLVFKAVYQEKMKRLYHPTSYYIQNVLYDEDEDED